MESLIKGNVLKSLISFALPIFAAMFLQALYGGVDLLVVGRFAETADVSGVSTGSILINTVTMVISGLSTGITVFVGQKVGEGEKEGARKAIGAGIALFGTLAIITSVAMVFATDYLAKLLHTPAEAYEQTCQYIRICSAGMLFVVLYNLLGAIFRGLGDSKTPLITVCIACLFNIAGDLFFVAVLHMGAGGAAIATVMAQAFSVISSIIIVRRKDFPYEVQISDIRFNINYIKSEMKLGIPIALQELLVGASFVFIQMIINAIDVTASAGVGVAEKVCSFIMLLPSAFSRAMSAFVAQNMGAGEPARAKNALKYGILTSLAAALFIGTFTFVKGDLLAGLFTKETEVICQAHDYLKSYAIDTVLTSIMFCLSGYYNGCGNTVFVMMQGIIGAVLIRIPVAYLMGKMANTSLFYIGLATPISSVIQIMMCLVYWKHSDKNSNNS